mgnify:CR=1 FL=1
MKNDKRKEEEEDEEKITEKASFVPAKINSNEWKKKEIKIQRLYSSPSSSS